MYSKVRNSRGGARWVRIQSADGVKTTLIYDVICEKKQRFEAIRAVHGID